MPSIDMTASAPDHLTHHDKAEADPWTALEQTGPLNDGCKTLEREKTSKSLAQRDSLRCPPKFLAAVPDNSPTATF